jgi:hypothetical protein
MGGISTLLGQAQMSPERLQELLAQVKANQAADPSLAAAPSPAPSPSPVPAQAAPDQQGMISRMLSGLSSLFMGGTSAKELAAGAPQQQTGGITAEELWRRQHPGQPFPGSR